MWTEDHEMCKQALLTAAQCTGSGLKKPEVCPSHPAHSAHSDPSHNSMSIRGLHSSLIRVGPSLYGALSKISFRAPHTTNYSASDASFTCTSEGAKDIRRLPVDCVIMHCTLHFSNQKPWKIMLYPPLRCPPIYNGSWLHCGNWYMRKKYMIRKNYGLISSSNFAAHGGTLVAWGL